MLGWPSNFNIALSTLSLFRSSLFSRKEVIPRLGTILIKDSLTFCTSFPSLVITSFPPNKVIVLFLLTLLPKIGFDYH